MRGGGSAYATSETRYPRIAGLVAPAPTCPRRHGCRASRSARPLATHCCSTPIGACRSLVLPRDRSHDEADLDALAVGANAIAPGNRQGAPGAVFETRGVAPRGGGGCRRVGPASVLASYGVAGWRRRSCCRRERYRAWSSMYSRRSPKSWRRCWTDLLALCRCSSLAGSVIRLARTSATQAA